MSRIACNTKSSRCKTSHRSNNQCCERVFYSQSSVALVRSFWMEVFFEKVVGVKRKEENINTFKVNLFSFYYILFHFISLHSIICEKVLFAESFFLFCASLWCIWPITKVNEKLSKISYQDSFYECYKSKNYEKTKLMKSLTYRLSKHHRIKVYSWKYE